MNKIIQQLLKSQPFPLKSQGTSMIPLLQSNDMIYFKKISFNLLKINDIIVIQLKNKFVTHRVIYKTNKFLITKGDNNPQSDGKIYPKQIIGQVYQIKRNSQIVDPEQLYLLQSTLYFQEIIKIKSLFEKGKIDFVFLKGLPLHLYFEKSHPQRIYADCDVLINKKDFQQAEKTILNFGYKKTELKNKKVENNYFKVINGFPVVFDIHLEPAFLMTQFSGLEALYPQKLIDRLTEELLNNKQQIKINNEKFLILNSSFLIFYLALHIFHHNFRGAFRYQFLDKVIRSSHLKIKDWQFINKKIKEYQLSSFVLPVFQLLHKYYQTPIPRSFFQTFQPFNLPTFKQIIKTSIFDDQPRTRAGIERFKLIFALSPYPWWKKIFVFTNPSVIYSIFWSLKQQLMSTIKYQLDNKE